MSKRRLLDSDSDIEDFVLKKTKSSLSCEKYSVGGLPEFLNLESKYF